MLRRILFVCSQGSSRALLAASLLQALDADQRWEVWSALPVAQQSVATIEEVLHEQGTTLLPRDRYVVPTSEMVWDEVIMLCSGATDT